MLEQVQNLDLLYEKETTTKLLEFKLKYLVSYAQLMRNYFQNMVFTDIANEMKRLDGLEENQDLNNLGRKIIVVTCMIVCPETIGQIDCINDLTDDHLALGSEIVTTERFNELFRNMC